MRIWLVKQTDHIGYDEYEGFVIRAESKERIIELVESDEGLEINSFANMNYDITEIKADGEEKIILDSYNAG